MDAGVGWGAAGWRARVSGSQAVNQPPRLRGARPALQLVSVQPSVRLVHEADLAVMCWEEGVRAFEHVLPRRAGSGIPSRTAGQAAPCECAVCKLCLPAGVCLGRVRLCLQRAQAVAEALVSFRREADREMASLDSELLKGKLNNKALRKELGETMVRVAGSVAGVWEGGGVSLRFARLCTLGSGGGLGGARGAWVVHDCGLVASARGPHRPFSIAPIGRYACTWACMRARPCAHLFVCMSVRVWGRGDASVCRWRLLPRTRK